MADDAAKAEYVKSKNVHHFFELLASRVLAKRPDNLIEFLREQLDDIETVEKNAHAHDPSAIHFAEQKDSASGAVKKTKKITIGVFGLDNAGKTAMLAAMAGEPDASTRPTIGFTPTFFSLDTFDVCVFDLGGGKNFRGVWPHYYHDCHGFIFVVDGAANEELMAASAAEFRNTFTHEYAQGKPAVLAVNKKDLAGCKTPEEVATAFDASRIVSKLKLAHTHAISEEGSPEIDDAVDWLLTTVDQGYDGLDSLVKKQSAEVAAAKKKALQEQAARVEANRKAEEAAAAAGAA